MRALLLSLALTATLSAQDPPLPDGASLDVVVQDVQGEVDVRVGPKDKWLTAQKGMRLAVGSKVCTGVESGVVIAFGTNSVALLAPCSVCDIRAFEMRGDQLVAQIHIEPGVAEVSVKQLQQFRTDFQVSTPRLTASVRGSRGLFSSECDEILDQARNLEGRVGTRQRDLAAGERTNSSNQSNHEICLLESVSDTVSEGATEQETGDENLLAGNIAGLDLNTSDVNVDSDASPSGDEREFEAPELDDGLARGLQGAVDLLAAHGFGELLDFLREGPDATGERMNTAQDQWDNVNYNLNTDEIYQEKREAILLLDANLPFGGILHDHRGLDYPQEHDLLHAFLEEGHAEGHAFDGLGDNEGDDDVSYYHELGHEAGLRQALDQALGEMQAEFQEELDANPDLQQGPRGWRDARENDFKNGPVGFTQMATDLRALTDQSASGDGFDTDLYGKALVELLHASYHERLAELPESPGPGGYLSEHQEFHQDVIDDLLTILQEEGVHAMIDAKADHLHEFWHDNTGVSENVQPGQAGYEEHEALHEALDSFQDHADYAADHAGD